MMRSSVLSDLRHLSGVEIHLGDTARDDLKALICVERLEFTRDHDL